MDSKLKSVHSVDYRSTQRQLLGRILGDGADQHLLGLLSTDVHIMLSGLLGKFINKTQMLGIL